MSSGFRCPSSPRHGLRTDNLPVCAPHYEEDARRDAKAAAASAPEIQGSCTPPLQPANLNLDELSKELDRRTREAQKLQEEVENATKLALERFCCQPPMMLHVGSCPDLDVQSGHQPPGLQPLSHGLDGLSLKVGRGHCTFPGKEAIDDYSQQVSALQKQLSGSHHQYAQQEFHFEKTIMRLQTELQRVRMEKDVLSELKMKDTRKHADEVERMQRLLGDLRRTKRSGERRLQEMEEAAESLSRRAESLQCTVKGVYSTLAAHTGRSGGGAGAGPRAPGSPGQLPLGALAAKVLQDLESENDRLRERLSAATDRPRSEEHKCQGKAETISKEQRDRFEQLMASHEQKVAILTQKLSSPRSNSTNLHVKLELIQKHPENPVSVHSCQVTDLESASSIQKERVCGAEQQLQTQPRVEEIQGGREHPWRSTGEQDSQLDQLTEELRGLREELVREKEQNQHEQDRSRALAATVEQLHKEREERHLVVQQLEKLVGTVKEDRQAQLESLRSGEQRQRELREESKALRAKLEVTREQLHGAGQQEARLQVLLKEKTREAKESQTLLTEKENELRRLEQEAQQDRSRLEEACCRCRVLQVEVEGLRSKLRTREQLVEILRLQMESGGEMTVQHGRTIDSLHQEKVQLSHQLREHQVEVQQLRAELARTKTVLCSLAEQRLCVQDAALERQQLSVQLEALRAQLLSLSEENEEQRRLRSSEREEHEGAVLRLKEQLRNAQAELDQAQGAVRTLEEADQRGLKVAKRMQQQITARREQIDTLLGRIQHLEETMEKLHQDKRSRALESRRQVQELASAREEKRRLAEDLAALRSRERRVKERSGQLEAALHKMSESFAERQDFIQVQEQQLVRLKLQHALELEGLRGQNLRCAASARPPAPPPPPARPLARRAEPASRKTSEAHAEPLKSPELQENSENRRPHGGGGSDHHRFPRWEGETGTTREPRLLKRTDRNRNRGGSIFPSETASPEAEVTEPEPRKEESWTSAKPEVKACGGAIWKSPFIRGSKKKNGEGRRQKKPTQKHQLAVVRQSVL